MCLLLGPSLHEGFWVEQACVEKSRRAGEGMRKQELRGVAEERPHHSTTSWKEVAVKRGLVPLLRSQAIGHKEEASVYTRRCLDWILQRVYSQREWSNTRTGCPRKQRHPHPWRYLREGHHPLDHVAKALALNTSRDGASTTSLDNLLHCWTTLPWKISPTSDLNFPSFCWKTFSFILSLSTHLSIATGYEDKPPERLQVSSVLPPCISEYLGMALVLQHHGHVFLAPDFPSGPRGLGLFEGPSYCWRQKQGRHCSSQPFVCQQFSCPVQQQTDVYSSSTLVNRHIPTALETSQLTCYFRLGCLVKW